MVTTIKPNVTTLDEELCALIARHAAAHHQRAGKLQYAETGVSEPIDEVRETTDEVLRLLEMASPGLDGDEDAAIHRLLDALEEQEVNG